MNFELTQEQKMIKNMVSEFARKELAPRAAEIDKSGEFPWESIKKMAALNLMGMPFPQEYGGAGVDSVSYTLAVEELSKACAATGLIMTVHSSVGAYPIHVFGTEEQKRKYLVPLAKGEMIGAFGLTEPGAGSDAAGVKATAVRDGDEYVLNGTKIFITNGGQAGVVNIICVTDKSKGAKGLSVFMVEKGTPGFRYGVREDTCGLKGSDTRELIFEDCRVPAENLLGKEGDGFKIGMVALDAGRVGIAAQAVGIAQAALEESTEYAKSREQFGRPIGKFEAIQWMLADMATRIEASRLLVHHAAYLKDQGVRYSKEAAMAKLYASETAMWSTVKAVQIHGGYGYTKEYRVERLFRDSKITEIYEGTSEIMRLVIANSLLR